MRLAAVLTLAAALFATPALALGQLGDWEVERGNNGHCNVSMGYKDPRDSNAEYFVAFGFSGTDDMMIVLAYDNWDLKEGAVVAADFYVDSELLMRQSQWTAANDKAITATWEINRKLLGALRTGSTITMATPTGKTLFSIPGAADALRKMNECEKKAKG
jgi:hypothetical protein